MSGRIACCVPFCRRTAPDLGDGTEILCRPHYTMAPKTLRRRLARLRRMAVARCDRQDRSGLEQAEALYDRTWEALKRSATEAAAGLR